MMPSNASPIASVKMNDPATKPTPSTIANALSASRTFRANRLRHVIVSIRGPPMYLRPPSLPPRSHNLRQRSQRVTPGSLFDSVVGGVSTGGPGSGVGLGRGLAAFGGGLLPLVGRAAVGRQVAGGVDQGHVAERLGEVAYQAARAGVVLLRQQAEVVAQREQPLESLHSLLVASLQRVVVGEPERAREEGPL